MSLTYNRDAEHEMKLLLEKMALPAKRQLAELRRWAEERRKSAEGGAVITQDRADEIMMAYLRAMPPLPVSLFDIPCLVWWLRRLRRAAQPKGGPNA